jgi:putative peptidoglycan lipid II flippase
VPSVVAFAALGDVVANAIYQSGRFTAADGTYVWAILAGASIGLTASTLGRLYASAYYAQGDTRTPLRFSLVRVFLATTLGYLAAVYLPGLLSIKPRWGIAGLTLASALAGVLEYILLRRTLIRRIGRTALPFSFLLRLWIAALVGAAVAWAIKMQITGWHPIGMAAVVLSAYGVCYLALSLAFKVPEATALAGRFWRESKRKVEG